MIAPTRWLHRLAPSLALVPWALHLVWQSARGWSLAWLSLVVVQGLLPVATVYLTRDLVNLLVTVGQGGLEVGKLQAVAPLIGALALVLVAGQALQGVMDWVRTSQGDLVQDHIMDLIHHQANRLDLSFYDDPQYYDCLERARNEAISRPLSLLESLSSVLQSSLTLVAMAGILLPFGAWVPLTLVLSTLPAFGFTLYYQRQRHSWQMRVTRQQRRVRHYEYFLTRRENIPEIRIFNLSPYFRRIYQGLRRRLRQEQLGIIRQQALADLGAGVLAIAVSGGVMVAMVWRALQGQVSLGDLTLLYQAFNQGQGLMKTLLNRAGQIYFNSLFIENLKTFLDLTPVLVEPDPALPLPVGAGLRFEQVGFRYPHSDRWALRDFNLTIEPGQFVAIVGTNGAGKSTLMKLLCRFYDPTEGRIWMGDRTLTTLSQEALRRAITVLFQHPVQYAETVADNIAYGAWETHPSPGEIARAAAISGADRVIQRLPQGYDEVLGKFLGNSELSTGEWQKIALARAFLRQAEIVLLDEPTSAMDSWAEIEWMGRFRQLVAGRIAIMITHRFTTAMQADRIYVMDQGTLVEAGTHAQLLALGGRYAQSWQQQMADQTPASLTPPPPYSLTA